MNTTLHEFTNEDYTKTRNLDANAELDPDLLHEYLSSIEKINDLKKLKDKITELKNSLNNFVLDGEPNGIKVSKSTFTKELEQLEETLTLQRLSHYINIIKKGFEKQKNGKINDINFNRWKEYENIMTDSLWYWPKRDNSGVHMSSYHGNFIPQIPNQAMLRYTKQGDTVLDVFLGSGTTLIECKRLGRNGIGVELQPNVAIESEKLINTQISDYDIKTKVLTGDSRKKETNEKIKLVMQDYGIDKVQLLIMHPPYADIIKFSNMEEDLSNTNSLKEFLDEFGKVIDNTYDLLEDDRYLVIVIGDKYQGKEWIPLGHLTMMEALKRGFLLKSVIVKNMEGNRAKRNQEKLWRLRALKGGFYIFKHEYVFILQKTNKSRIIDELKDFNRFNH